MATRPDKYLKYDEQNYVGYFQQLTTIIRANAHADSLLDELLPNPLAELPGKLADGPKAALLNAYRAVDAACKEQPTTKDLQLDPVGCIKRHIKANRLIAQALAEEGNDEYSDGGSAVKE